MVHMSHAKKVYVWTVSAVVAFIILGAGIPKIFGSEDWSRSFELWGYPSWFRIVVGWMEVLGAILLVIPRTSLISAGVLTVMMAGATYTQLVYGSTLATVLPLVLGLLMASIMWIRWPHPSTETGRFGEPIEKDSDDSESPIVAR